jgi:signal transduction histidine kinase
VIARRILRAPFEGHTWRAWLNALACVIPAVLAFALAILGLIGAALSVFTVGLPILVGVLFLLRATARYVPAPARLILGWTWSAPGPLSGPSVSPAPSGRGGGRSRVPGLRGPRGGLLGRGRAVLRDGAAWRALGYCLIKLPLSVIAAYLGVFIVIGFAAMTSPIWLRWVPERFALPSAWSNVALGVACFLLCPWMVRLCTALDRILIRALLEPDPARARIAQLEAGRAALQADAAAVLRRVERDLHDGTQARLVALAVSLSRIERRTGEEVRPLIRDAQDNITEALAELRDIIRAVHPPALDDGLPTALQTLAARSPVPVDLHVDLPGRPGDAAASALYFTAAELLTNVARHAGATRATVTLHETDDTIRLSVCDDGRGGARTGGGTGLAGLARRAGALDGSFTVDSPAGGPTIITMTLPEGC